MGPVLHSNTCLLWVCAYAMPSTGQQPPLAGSNFGRSVTGSTVQRQNCTAVRKQLHQSGVHCLQTFQYPGGAVERAERNACLSYNAHPEVGGDLRWGCLSCLACWLTLCRYMWQTRTQLLTTAIVSAHSISGPMWTVIFKWVHVPPSLQFSPSGHVSGASAGPAGGE